MADYNLSGLSSRSFEQLIQSLAAKIIGPNIIVFGDGPDGGREATFEGPIPYPSVTEQWDGFGVVQAKFLQRPQDSQRDGEWALQQLRSELKDFADPTKDRREIDYYIFATNVVLTPVQDKGSKDKVEAVFKEFEGRIPLKGYDVWDYDKIRTYLDGNEDVRRAYAAFITSGDVLAQAIEWLKPQRPDFEQILTNFLQKELLTDQFANLEQAGHATDDRIPIARVFIDLPTFGERLIDPPQETLNPDGFLPPGFISEVLEAATELRKSSTSISPLQGFAERQPIPDIGRVVLVGGPGQGKTTIGQFICQLFRTSLLRGKADHLLSHEVRQALNVIITYCGEEGIEIPAARRFPVRIELNKFATALASKDSTGINSVLSYLTDLIRKRTNSEISPEDFRRWLSLYPWVLILDGLDEVPASSNRNELLSAIQDFWVDAAQSDADILVIATTRPQGYNQDFSPTYYQHRWLAPLSTARAMHYGRRLADARYGSNQERRDKVVTRLERASQNEATARLMRSPLQVTIMTTLVDRMGQPPQERWNLFKEYYNVIYQREVERDIPVATILRDYKSDIDAIHSHVGLLLQVESERTGTTDARLSADNFSAVVENRLVGEGHQGDDLRALQSKIIEAATDRLVFLVGLQANEVGFEIRSLQEFMAAEGLMDGTDEVVKKRLREIAPVVNWRNVFLFAAGKCFAERQSFRDSIYTICAELNDDTEDEVSRATLAGSQLCLDLLEDGAARQQPKYNQILARLALRLLDLPPDGYHSRLAGLYEPRLEQIYREEIARGLGQSDAQLRLGTWACLISLIEANVEWAKEVGDENWPRDEGELYNLLQVSSSIKAKSWIGSKLVSVLPRLSPKALYKLFEMDDLSLFEVLENTELDWFDALGQVLTGSLLRSRAEIPLNLIEENLSPDRLVPLVRTRSGSSVRRLTSTIRVKNTPLHKNYSARLVPLKDMPNASPAWIPFIAAARFLEHPSKETLASELRAISQDFEPNIAKWHGNHLPWPLTASLAVCENASDIETIAERVERGDFGDIEEWEAAENRWESYGVTVEDLHHMTDARWPFDSEISRSGFPLADYSLGISVTISEELEPTLNKLLELHEELEASHVRSYVAYFTLLAMGSLKRRPNKEAIEFSASRFRVLISDLKRDNLIVDLDALSSIAWGDNLSDEWLDILDSLGRQRGLRLFRVSDKFVALLSEAFRVHSDKSGLLWLLSMAAIRGENTNVPSTLLEPENFDDPEFRNAATIISISQGDWGPADVLSLTDRTVNLIKDHPEVDINTLAQLSERKVPKTAVYSFLLELRRRFTPSEWKPMQQITQALNDSLRRRTSRLAESQVWLELSLPEGPNSTFK